jgi:DNA-binding NtrC family response regulator
MEKKNVLIVSARPTNKEYLLSVLNGLPITTFHAATIQQAREVLSSQFISVVFCEEALEDGSYRDLLSHAFLKPRMTRYVVLLCTSEWDEYLRALRLGASDAIRCPLQSADIELALIRATRQESPLVGKALTVGSTGATYMSYVDRKP